MGGAVTVQIRTAGPGDLDSLRGIVRRSSLVYEDGRDDLLAHPETLEFSFPADGDWETRVAVSEEGRIIGFATASFPDGHLELEDLFVEPDQMRGGVGRALIAEMAQLARRHGVGRIEVIANPNALDFYEKTGFVVEGTVPTQFGPGIRMHLDVG